MLRKQITATESLSDLSSLSSCKEKWTSPVSDIPMKPPLAVGGEGELLHRINILFKKKKNLDKSFSLEIIHIFQLPLSTGRISRARDVLKMCLRDTSSDPSRPPQNWSLLCGWGSGDSHIFQTGFQNTRGAPGCFCRT